MSDDEQKLNRRVFLQYSAVISTTAGLAGIALKTDALAQVQRFGALRDDGGSPYPYQLGPGG